MTTLGPELQARGEALVSDVLKRARDETDPSVRISSLFIACYQEAIREGFSPMGFLTFCSNTIGAIVLAREPDRQRS